MGVIQHNSTGSILSQSNWEGVSTHLIGGNPNLDVVTTAETQTLTNKTLTAPTLNTPIAIGTGITITKSGTVYTITITPPDELRVTQTNAYDAMSQYPLLQIQQLSTGECAFRYLHADDTGTKNWIHGQLGRKNPDNAIHRDWYLFLDGTKVALSALYATDSTCGRILINTDFWHSTAPQARLEVRGSADELQCLVKGNDTQTAQVFQVRKSDDSNICQMSVGEVDFGEDVHLASGKKIIGDGTGSNGIVLKNPKNSTASALSGTQKDIEIDIGGVPYYFTVYPTKA